MISTISANSFGSLFSNFGFRRLERSLTHNIFVRNSFIPSFAVLRLQPNTSSATRGLLSRSDMITSPIAERLPGQGIISTNRPINSITCGVIPFRTTVDVFMIMSPFCDVQRHYKRYISKLQLPNGSLKKTCSHSQFSTWCLIRFLFLLPSSH